MHFHHFVFVLDDFVAWSRESTSTMTGRPDANGFSVSLVAQGLSFCLLRRHRANVSRERLIFFLGNRFVFLQIFLDFRPLCFDQFGMGCLYCSSPFLYCSCVEQADSEKAFHRVRAIREVCRLAVARQGEGEFSAHVRSHVLPGQSFVLSLERKRSTVRNC
jgi:hypothetical protein